MAEQNGWQIDTQSQSTPPSMHMTWTAPVITMDATLTNGGHVDGDDYTYPAVNLPDCRTYTERVEERFVDIETAMQLLIDEVQHLREDIKRITTGESTL